MGYKAAQTRYGSMQYRYCGKSGLRLPAISFGLWNNFGDVYDYGNSLEMLKCAFDLGINHFDLANNYGPPPGTAESNFGKMLKSDFMPYRDELIISTKAGYTMWEGPYGDWGSKKYLIASLDQSLKRMGLDYVDIFYHHRPDPNTPVSETVDALELVARQGKALYVGISNYDALEMAEILPEFERRGIPCLINQFNYSMLNRKCEDGLLGLLGREGVGMSAYMPLYQGRLTDRYLNGIPADSRAAGPAVSLDSSGIEQSVNEKVVRLSEVAKNRGQSMAQMAIAWVLRHEQVATALIGASKPAQITDCVSCLSNLGFSQEELSAIDAILKG